MSVRMFVCLSVLPSAAWNNSAPAGWIFLKLDIWIFLENLSRKFKFHYNLTLKLGTLYKDIFIFIISHWILPRIRNVSDKSCRENQNTHFMFDNFFQSFCLSHNTEKYCPPDRPLMTIWRKRIGCWISFYHCLYNSSPIYHWSWRIVTDFFIKPY